MAFALRLPDTLGYPATPHNFFPPALTPVTGIVPGVLYPIEEKGISLEDARTLADDAGCDLELVQIDKHGKEVAAKAAHQDTDNAPDGKDA